VPERLGKKNVRLLTLKELSMRKVVMAVLATATLGSVGLVAAPGSAQAQTAQVTSPIAALQSGDLHTTYVQWRGDRRYYGGGRYYGRPAYGYGNRPYYGRPYGYYRRDRGGAAAAGVLGLATGAIIGGAIAQQQQQPVYVAPNQGSVAYCSQRFRSYDPASGTYLGYDGLRHACP
jgi:hypothetical protein